MNFLQVIKNSFIKCLETHVRSNEKLKILHGAIAKDIQDKLGSKYQIFSLGFNEDKEDSINGKYIDKKVDIVIKKDNKVVAGIAVKFVMSNYSQNSNNYFENMLGETANIRSNHIPYFQIFILAENMPYFDNEKNISKWEEVTEHNIKKYIILSQDDIDLYLHTSNKILLCLLNIERTKNLKTKYEYLKYYLSNNFKIEYSKSKYDFGKNIIYNNYDEFINKICYRILSE